MDHGLENLKIKPQKSSLKHTVNENKIQLCKQVHFTKDELNNNHNHHDSTMKDLTNYEHYVFNEKDDQRNMQHYHEEYIEDNISELESSELELSELEVN